jgi:hypothetical protein
MILALRRFYAADYEYFGFTDIEATDEAPVPTENFVNQFTDAIFERNRVLSAHIAFTREYEHLELISRQVV